MDGVSATTRRVQPTIAPWLDAYLRWLEAHPPLTFDGHEYDLFAEGFQAAIAAIDEIALTAEERNLILLVRAEQAKRDARGPTTGRMRWARQIINLATTDGPRPVEADVYGAWAVHAPLQAGHALYIHWAVSHVPTGLSVGVSFEKSRARKLCQQLHTSITAAGWTAIEPEMRGQILRAVKPAHGYSETEAEAEAPMDGSRSARHLANQE